MFYTGDEENIRAILLAPEDRFELGDSRSANMTPVLGHGLFTAEGVRWRQHRTMTRSLLRSIESTTMVERVEQLLQNLFTDESEWSQEVDLQSLFSALFLDPVDDGVFAKTENNLSHDYDAVGAKRPNRTSITEFGKSLDALAMCVSYSTVLGG
ncbi:hypothetical protein ACLMJK_004691 [Lecanora helva]